MNYKSKAITLTYNKQGESSIICKIFTEQQGLQTFIIKGVRSSKSKKKLGLFQALQLVKINATYSEKRGLQYLSEISVDEPIAIEKVNSTSGLFETETVYYNGNTGNVLSNCVRGTAAPFRGQTPKNTPAGEHSSGAKVYSAYAVTMVPTVVTQAGQPSTVTEFNSFTFNLISAASSTKTGGGFQCLAGPVNDRA